MHRYLRSIGFLLYRKEKDIANLLDTLAKENMGVTRTAISEQGEVRMEIRAHVARNMGVCMVGSIDDDGSFVREYYYPYLISDHVSTTVPVSIHRHVDRDAYSCLADDQRVGISLIFRMDNSFDYLDRMIKGLPCGKNEARLSAFSDDGMILLPVKKTVKQLEMIKANLKNRDNLIQAARSGDEGAMQSLAADDMNTYNMVTGRLKKEDIYSIVDSCFMPQGVECDIYQIIGEITAVVQTRNELTGENIYDLTILCNDLQFQVAINAVDLKGAPQVGRRFKGRIWMQGRVDFK